MRWFRPLLLPLYFDISLQRLTRPRVCEYFTKNIPSLTAKRIYFFFSPPQIFLVLKYSFQFYRQRSPLFYNLYREKPKRNIVNYKFIRRLTFSDTDSLFLLNSRFLSLFSTELPLAHYFFYSLCFILMRFFYVLLLRIFFETFI